MSMSLVFEAAFVTAAIFLFILIAGLLVHLSQRLIVLLLSLALGRRTAALAANYLTFPGTVIHELSHAIAALLTGAKVTSFSLLPSGDTLGHVSIISRGSALKRALQRTLTSIAPVFGGALCLYLLRVRLFPLCTQCWMQLIAGYLYISILLHMDLSAQDLKTGAKGMPLCLLLLFGFCLLFVYLDPSLFENLPMYIKRYLF